MLFSINSFKWKIYTFYCNSINISVSLLFHFIHKFLYFTFFVAIPIYHSYIARMNEKNNKITSLFAIQIPFFCLYNCYSIEEGGTM